MLTFSIGGYIKLNLSHPNMHCVVLFCFLCSWHHRLSRFGPLRIQCTQERWCPVQLYLKQWGLWCCQKAMCLMTLGKELCFCKWIIRDGVVQAVLYFISYLKPQLANYKVSKLNVSSGRSLRKFILATSTSNKEQSGMEQVGIGRKKRENV